MRSCVRVSLLSLLTTCLLGAAAGGARGADEAGGQGKAGAEILQELKAFGQMATVLHVAAHPDDENTQLITYLARGRGYRTGYLSITRGDGGQNLLGPEFDEELGLIRTHELLAARNLDKGRQFFTRAIDFGFSKSWEETLRLWDRKEVLGDVVRVIRTFRPDVIIARFNPDVPGINGGTHGHHTASAILAREAFPLAGDPTAYPEQLTPAGGGLKPFQPKRLLLNAGGFGRGGGGGGGAGAQGVRMNVAGIDPVLGESFGAIAGQSRAMHKSQGFGGGPGAGGGRGRGGQGAGGAVAPQYESFTLLAGAPATDDIMDGIDTTWGRTGQTGAEIAKLTEAAIAAFDAKAPDKSVPALLAIKKKVAEVVMDGDPVVLEKNQDLDRIIADCLGIRVQTTVASAEVVPGEEVALQMTATNPSSVPILWGAVAYPRGEDIVGGEPPRVQLAPDRNPGSMVQKLVLPASTEVSQPYWLREERGAGIYRVSDSRLIGVPVNPPVVEVRHSFKVMGQVIDLLDQPVQVIANAPVPQQKRPLDVIAPVSLHFPFEIRVFAPSRPEDVSIDLTAHRPGASGTVQLDLPAGWKAEPVSQPFTLAAPGDRSTVTFHVTPPSAALPTAATIRAHAEVGGRRITTDRKEIRYDHIPFLLLQPAATLKAVDVEMVTKGKSVGYVAGAGDSVAACIEQMGYSVKRLEAKDLTPETLKSLDALVIGVRAFDIKGNELAAAAPALTEFANGGGTIIAQYNRNGSPKIGPLSVRVANIRTTDETAPPTFLAPDNAALTGPNKITAADFDHWVQERGIYYPQSFDPAFTPLLAFTDPEEQPASGSLLVARQGKGYIVYTSLVFFRELPAGVPGAYRLFANLLSLGKP